MTASPFAAGSKLSKMAAVYNGWRRRDALAPLNMVYEALSREHGVSVSSVKRYIAHIDANGYQPKEHKPRPLAAWDNEALNYFKVFYLKVSRDAGRCTVRNAYQHTVAKAAREGWRVGSEQSAYVHAREIHAALKLYVKGGSRALDNLFYIARDLSSLRPFQIVVGDQHRFDFWVIDEKGKYFRPECYLWLDMRTRLVYGIAFDRNYNTRTVLRALKEGVKRFGKFESTYNDNGTGEKSAVADYTIEQLQNYGMRFSDEGDLYRTETGAYVVEGADGKMVSVVKSRAEWKKQNRRIYANVKNAKTKPIERFFSTLEQILRDMITPGMVIDLTDGAATEEESSRRLEWQKRNGYILPLEEFAQRVINALKVYERREHGTLKHSPLEELVKAIKIEGWRPTRIKDQDIKHLFLERAYAKVQGDRVALAGRQFIGPSLTQEMIRSNRGNLTGLNRKKVELRYDPDDLDSGIWAIDPRNGEAVFCNPVVPIAMLNDKAASAALEQKRRNMKAVRVTYNEMTEGARTLFEPNKFKELAESQAVANIPTPEPPAIPAGEFSALVAASTSAPESQEISADEFNAMVATQITLEPKIRERSKLIFLTPRDRYESLRIAMDNNQIIPAEDLAFMTDYEEKMKDAEKEYFASQSRLNKQTRGVIT